MAVSYRHKRTTVGGRVPSSGDFDAAGQLLMNTTDGRLFINGSNGVRTFADLNHVGLLGGSRNKIINGNFDIWQRGVSKTGAGYAADRWVSVPATGAVPFISRVYTSNDLCHYSLSWNFTTTRTTTSYIAQRIENLRQFSGRTWTLTFWARVTSGSLSVNASVARNYGTGGSPTSTVVQSAIGATTVTTTWTKVTGSFTIPSLSSASFGSNNNDHLEVRINRVSSGAYLQIARVSLVEGDATLEPDPFSPRTLAEEFFLCQRYFRKSTAILGAWFDTNTLTVGVMFDNPMRASPSNILNPGASVLEFGIAARDITAMYGALPPIGGQLDVAASGTVTNLRATGLVAAESFSFDAEL